MSTPSLSIPETVSAPRGLALLAKGFRPFFLFGAVYALVSLPLWLLVLAGRLNPGAYLGSVFWHAHEMVFGFAIAIVAGFLLTAIGNWTSQRTAEGPLLGALVGLWLLGRVGVLAADTLPAYLPAILDLSFLPALVAVCARPIIATRSRRNYLFVGMLTALWLSNLAVHLGALGIAPGWQRHGNLIGVDLLNIALVVMTGRVVPMFTRNATGVQSIRSQPILEKISVIGVISIVFFDALQLPTNATAILSGLAGVFVLLRMLHWGTRHTVREPLLWILHVGSLWLAAGLMLRFFSTFTSLIPPGAALHALTAGALGSLTLGMMTRVTHGHTGRMLVVPGHMKYAFFMIVAAALTRVIGPYVVADTLIPLVIAGSLWSIAFAFYVVTYARALLTPRIDNRPG